MNTITINYQPNHILHFIGFHVNWIFGPPSIVLPLNQRRGGGGGFFDLK